MGDQYAGYQDLDESKREVRILRLLPNTHSSEAIDLETITCSLEKVSLNQANPFYALSYVWGPALPNLPILLNGQKVHVRHNLWIFLCALRDRFCQGPEVSQAESSGIRVWADALCIHQSNPQERSHQVGLMGEIYQCADAVYAWLGDLDETQAAAAMRYVDHVAQMRAQGARWRDISQGNTDDSDGLESLTTSAYWNRLWIKQEIILARDVWIFYGTHVVNWSDLRFAANLQPHQTNQTIKTTHTRPGRSFTSSRDSTIPRGQEMKYLLDSRTATASTHGLPELVVRFGEAKCQDTRDRIYALLSLTDSETRSAIQIDYEKHVLQIMLQYYPQWTGEHLETLDGVPVYHVHSFCSQMTRILTARDLQSLVKSAESRTQINTRAVFVSSMLSEISKVSVIASMDCAGIREATSRSEQPGGWALALSVNTRARGPPARIQERLIYASVVPAVGDILAHIGSRVVFLQGKSPDGDQSGREGSLQIIGAGKDMAHLNAAQLKDGHLRTILLPHPLWWMRRQLSDARLSIGSSADTGSYNEFKSKRDLPARIHVIFNTAAIVSLLLESEQFDRMKSDELLARTGSEQDEEPSDTSLESVEKWSPYQYGIDRKILIPCCACKLSGPGKFAVKRQKTAQAARSRCECTWLPGEQQRQCS